VVDQPAVDLFGHAVVVAAVAGFHVEHVDPEALRRDRREAAVRVAQDEQPVGFLLAK
jgi:hypothetical protein